MSISTLIRKIIEEFSLQEEQVVVNKNRYNSNLGTIKISSSIPLGILNNTVSRFYKESGFGIEAFDGFFNFARGDDNYLVGTYNCNGEIILDISRNHFFSLSL